MGGIDNDRAVEILNRQREEALRLKEELPDSPEFVKWRRDTAVALEKIFTTNSRNVSDFRTIRYRPKTSFVDMPDHDLGNAHIRGLTKAGVILESIIDEIREFEVDDESNSGNTDHLSIIERICLRFHSSARQLQSRYKNRNTLTINDEYDVQDLLHAFLRLHFDDIRPEEWTPSYAGKSSRVDFLLKKERIVIEVKKTRSSLGTGKVGEELIVDRTRYASHPDCDTLVCFVYDPEGRIGNPIGLERDLEGIEGDLNFRVIVAPKA